MRHATRVIGYTLYLLLAACAKTHEPKTTQEQEAAFQQTFGFPAPETITEIKYFALSNRGFVDAAYGIRVRCTYDEAIFNRILKQGKFREKPESSPGRSGRHTGLVAEKYNNGNCDLHDSRKGGNG